MRKKESSIQPKRLKRRGRDIYTGKEEERGDGSMREESENERELLIVASAPAILKEKAADKIK